MFKLIRIILDLINNLAIYIQRKTHLIFLYRRKQLNLIDEFHYSIMRDWVITKKTFGKWNLFYQTNPMIRVEGVRPTISRINNYRLLDYINNDSIVLDIGSNTGFLSFYLSSYVKEIDAVEIDKDLFLIAKKAKEYLSIQNVNLINQNVYECELRSYDLVMSYAIHGWVDMEIETYIIFLKDHSKQNGYIIIESHNNIEDINNLKSALSNLKMNVHYTGISDDHLGNLRNFFIFN